MTFDIVSLTNTIKDFFVDSYNLYISIVDLLPFPFNLIMRAFLLIIFIVIIVKIIGAFI